MSDKDSAKEVIDAYRKRQQRADRTPKFVLGLSALLLIVGAAAIIFWLTGAEPPQIALFTTDTPTITPSLTPSPVPPTLTPSQTPTESPPTETLEPSITPTLSGPFIYVAEEGDSLFTISERFEVDILVLIEVNKDRLDLDPSNPIIQVGDEVLIPAPDTELPTATPLPEGLPYGYVIEYTVKAGDSLDAIAIEFNSTVEDILEQNEDLEDPNSIYIGQILTVRVNLVTPAPTEEATEAPETTPGTISTLTPEPTATP